MIKDLRRAGHERSHDIMTTLLSQYARTRMDDEYFDVTSRSDGKDHVEQSFREYAIFVEQAIAWCRIDPFIPVRVAAAPSLTHPTFIADIGQPTD